MRVVIRLLIIALLTKGWLFASVVLDSDFDGVADSYDECPNTPFSDLVDSRGCSIKSVNLSKVVKNLTLIVGANYSNYRSRYGNKTRTLSESFELDYRIRKIKYMLYISRFSSHNKPLKQYDKSSFADTRLSLSYDLDNIFDNVSISIGGGIALPNYKGTLHNNATDFFSSINVSYHLDKVSLFGGYIFTKIGDHDTNDLKYQDRNALSFGIGYSLMPNLYNSISYYYSNSSIKSFIPTRNISFYSYYNLSKENFITNSISHDLVDGVNSNSFGVKFGHRMWL